jgi:hypothetical protein
MVITDGMPDIYKDIFEEYNRKADMRVRMFMYQIGDEEPGAREMQWIAHNNNGEKMCTPCVEKDIPLLVKFQFALQRLLFITGPIHCRASEF